MYKRLPGLDSQHDFFKAFGYASFKQIKFEILLNVKSVEIFNRKNPKNFTDLFKLYKKLHCKLTWL